MLEHFEEASRRVLKYTQNRENVSPRGGPLQTKLAALVPRLGTAVPAVTVNCPVRLLLLHPLPPCI
jgi:hypothetical protein